MGKIDWSAVEEKSVDNAVSGKSSVNKTINNNLIN
jgi:hypothetical protein